MKLFLALSRHLKHLVKGKGKIMVWFNNEKVFRDLKHKIAHGVDQNHHLFITLTKPNHTQDCRPNSPVSTHCALYAHHPP